MTAEEFVRRIIGYSGKDYTDEQVVYVLEWARQNESYLDGVYEVFVKSWDARWRTPPLVKNLNDLLESQWENQPNPYVPGEFGESVSPVGAE